MQEFLVAFTKNLWEIFTNFCFFEIYPSVGRSASISGEGYFTTEARWLLISVSLLIVGLFSLYLKNSHTFPLYRFKTLSRSIHYIIFCLQFGVFFSYITYLQLSFLIFNLYEREPQDSNVWGMSLANFFHGDLLVFDSFSLSLKMFLSYIYIFVYLFILKSVKTQRIYKFEYIFVLYMFLSFALLLVSSLNLFLIYFLIESLSLFIYILIILHKGLFKSVISAEISLKYFILNTFTFSFFNLGVLFVYGSGVTSLHLQDVKVLLYNYLHGPGEALPLLLYLGFLALLVGLLFKLGAAPLFIWVPEIYDGAPTSLVFMMSSVFKLILIGVLMRFLFYGFIDLNIIAEFILFFFGCSSIFVGSFGAAVQRRLKRFYAYSSIVQLGYVLLILSPLTFNSIKVAIFYYYTYLLGTIVFFFVLLMFKSNYFNKFRKNLLFFSDLKDFWFNSPVLTFFIVIALLSWAGYPPLAGFITKFFMLLFFANFELFNLIIYVLIFGVLGFFYYFRVLQSVFFYSSKLSHENNLAFSGIKILDYLRDSGKELIFTVFKAPVSYKSGHLGWFLWNYALFVEEDPYEFDSDLSTLLLEDRVWSVYSESEYRYFSFRSFFHWNFFFENIWNFITYILMFKIIKILSFFMVLHTSLNSFLDIHGVMYSLTNIISFEMLFDLKFNLEDCVLPAEILLATPVFNLVIDEQDKKKFEEFRKSSWFWNFLDKWFSSYFFYIWLSRSLLYIQWKAGVRFLISLLFPWNWKKILNNVEPERWRWILIFFSVQFPKFYVTARDVWCLMRWVFWSIPYPFAKAIHNILTALPNTTTRKKYFAYLDNRYGYLFKWSRWLLIVYWIPINYTIYYSLGPHHFNLIWSRYGVFFFHLFLIYLYFWHYMHSEYEFRLDKKSIAVLKKIYPRKYKRIADFFYFRFGRNTDRQYNSVYFLIFTFWAGFCWLFATLPEIDAYYISWWRYDDLGKRQNVHILLQSQLTDETIDKELKKTGLFSKTERFRLLQNRSWISHWLKIHKKTNEQPFFLRDPEYERSPFVQKLGKLTLQDVDQQTLFESWATLLYKENARDFTIPYKDLFIENWSDFSKNEHHSSVFEDPSFIKKAWEPDALEQDYTALPLALAKHWKYQAEADCWEKLNVEKTKPIKYPREFGDPFEGATKHILPDDKFGTYFSRPTENWRTIFEREDDFWRAARDSWINKYMNPFYNNGLWDSIYYILKWQGWIKNVYHPYHLYWKQSPLFEYFYNTLYRITWETADSIIKFFPYAGLPASEFLYSKQWYLFFHDVLPAAENDRWNFEGVYGIWEDYVYGKNNSLSHFKKLYRKAKKLNLLVYFLGNFNDPYLHRNYFPTYEGWLNQTWPLGWLNYFTYDYMERAKNAQLLEYSWGSVSSFDMWNIRWLLATFRYEAAGELTQLWNPETTKRRFGLPFIKPYIIPLEDISRVTSFFLKDKDKAYLLRRLNIDMPTLSETYSNMEYFEREAKDALENYKIFRPVFNFKAIVGDELMDVANRIRVIYKVTDKFFDRAWNTPALHIILRHNIRNFSQDLFEFKPLVYTPVHDPTFDFRWYDNYYEETKFIETELMNPLNRYYYTLNEEMERYLEEYASMKNFIKYNKAMAWVHLTQFEEEPIGWEGIKTSSYWTYQTLGPPKKKVFDEFMHGIFLQDTQWEKYAEPFGEWLWNIDEAFVNRSFPLDMYRLINRRTAYEIGVGIIDRYVMLNEKGIYFWPDVIDKKLHLWDFFRDWYEFGPQMYNSFQRFSRPRSIFSNLNDYFFFVPYYDLEDLQLNWIKEVFESPQAFWAAGEFDDLKLGLRWDWLNAQKDWYVAPQLYGLPSTVEELNAWLNRPGNNLEKINPAWSQVGKTVRAQLQYYYTANRLNRGWYFNKSLYRKFKDSYYLSIKKTYIENYFWHSVDNFAATKKEFLRIGIEVVIYKIVRYLWNHSYVFRGISYLVGKYYEIKLYWFWTNLELQRKFKDFVKWSFFASWWHGAEPQWGSWEEWGPWDDRYTLSIWKFPQWLYEAERETPPFNEEHLDYYYGTGEKDPHLAVNNLFIDIDLYNKLDPLNVYCSLTRFLRKLLWTYTTEILLDYVTLPIEDNLLRSPYLKFWWLLQRRMCPMWVYDDYSRYPKVYSYEALPFKSTLHVPERFNDEQFAFIQEFLIPENSGYVDMWKYKMNRFFRSFDGFYQRNLFYWTTWLRESLLGWFVRKWYHEAIGERKYGVKNLEGGYLFKFWRDDFVDDWRYVTRNKDYFQMLRYRLDLPYWESKHYFKKFLRVLKHDLKLLIDDWIIRHVLIAGPSKEFKPEFKFSAGSAGRLLWKLMNITNEERTGTITKKIDPILKAAKEFGVMDYVRIWADPWYPKINFFSLNNTFTFNRRQVLNGAPIIQRNQWGGQFPARFVIERDKPKAPLDFSKFVWFDTTNVKGYSFDHLIPVIPSRIAEHIIKKESPWLFKSMVGYRYIPEDNTFEVWYSPEVLKKELKLAREKSRIWTGFSFEKLFKLTVYKVRSNYIRSQHLEQAKKSPLAREFIYADFSKYNLKPKLARVRCLSSPFDIRFDFYYAFPNNLKEARQKPNVNFHKMFLFGDYKCKASERDWFLAMGYRTFGGPASFWELDTFMLQNTYAWEELAIKRIPWFYLYGDVWISEKSRTFSSLYYYPVLWEHKLEKWYYSFINWWNSTYIGKFYKFMVNFPEKYVKQAIQAQYSLNYLNKFVYAVIKMIVDPFVYWSYYVIDYSIAFYITLINFFYSWFLKLWLFSLGIFNGEPLWLLKQYNAIISDETLFPIYAALKYTYFGLGKDTRAIKYLVPLQLYKNIPLTYSATYSVNLYWEFKHYIIKNLLYKYYGVTTYEKLKTICDRQIDQFLFFIAKGDSSILNHSDFKKTSNEIRSYSWRTRSELKGKDTEAFVKNTSDALSDNLAIYVAIYLLNQAKFFLMKLFYWPIENFQKITSYIKNTPANKEVSKSLDWCVTYLSD